MDLRLTIYPLISSIGNVKWDAKEIWIWHEASEIQDFYINNNNNDDDSAKNKTYLEMYVCFYYDLLSK